MGRSPIHYRLSDPGFTIYHRAALGGLVATIKSWRPVGRGGKGVKKPLSFEPRADSQGGTLREGETSVTLTFDLTSVKIEWDAPTTDRQALALILKASFLRTNDGMIYLPGQGFGNDREDVLIAAHNAYSQTFLQHAKKRPGSGIGSVTIRGDDDETFPLSYKKVDRYSHQTAQGTSLLGEGWETDLEEELPESASIPQSLIPGATGGAQDLAVSPEHAFLLHFLMVACPVFMIRSRKWESKVQSCVVVPDVTDLEDFSERLALVGNDPVHRLTNHYLGRVAGGAEEAALRFLIDLRSHQGVKTLGVAGARVYAMGKVAWDGNQQNRSWIASVKTPRDYPDLNIFEAAARALGRSKIIKTKKGEAFAIPVSPLPDLIAANIAADGNWCDGFVDLVAKKQDFVDLCYRREGLRAMKNAILSRDGEDQLVIQCFQKAWSMKMGAMGDRTRNEGALFSRLVETERERIRNELLRAKTSDQLAGWLTRFMADATRGGSPREFAANADALRKFIFNPRNVDRLKNLLLFALVSYSAPDSQESPTNPVEN